MIAVTMILASPICRDHELQRLMITEREDAVAAAGPVCGALTR
jgi:hypothetical protein